MKTKKPDSTSPRKKDPPKLTDQEPLFEGEEKPTDEEIARQIAEIPW